MRGNLIKVTKEVIKPLYWPWQSIQRRAAT